MPLSTVGAIVASASLDYVRSITKERMLVLHVLCLFGNSTLTQLYHPTISTYTALADGCAMAIWR